MQKRVKGALVSSVVVAAGWIAWDGPMADAAVPSVYSIVEGREANTDQPVLVLLGGALTSVKSYEIDGAGLPFPAPLAASVKTKNLVVLRLPVGLPRGMFQLRVMYGNGRSLSSNVTLRIGAPPDASVDVPAFTPSALTDVSDASKLGGNDAAFFRNASNINAGTLDPSRFSAIDDLVAENRIGAGATQVAAGDHNHDARYDARYVQPSLLSAAGTLNTASNPVDWTRLKGVPAGLADGVDNDTTYSNGAGLGLSGTTFSVNFAGTGSATTASRSDHDHDAAYVNVGGDTMTGTLTHLAGASTAISASGSATRVIDASSSGVNSAALFAAATGTGSAGVSASSTQATGFGLFGTNTGGGIGTMGTSTVAGIGLEGVNSGTGLAFVADHTGTAGSIASFRAGGVERAGVDRNGTWTLAPNNAAALQVTSSFTGANGIISATQNSSGTAIRGVTNGTGTGILATSNSDGPAMACDAIGSGNALSIRDTGVDVAYFDLFGKLFMTLNSNSECLEASGSTGTAIARFTNTGIGDAVFAQNTGAGNAMDAQYVSTGTGRALNVTSGSASSPAAFFTATGGGYAFEARAAGTGTNIALFSRNSNNVARIDANGRGYFNGGTQTGGADFAESVEVDRPKAEFEAGDVMVIDPKGVRRFAKSASANSTAVAGVYSTKPGVLAHPYDVADEAKLASRESGEIPLAITGIVPCKVCDEGGAIRAGDLLVTASIPGHAMKAPKDVAIGTVVGKALGALASGRGIVEILVTAR